MTWNNVTIDIKLPKCTRKDAFHVEEDIFVSNKTDRIAKILEAKYKPAKLNELRENLSQLKNNQKEQLHNILNKHLLTTHYLSLFFSYCRKFRTLAISIFCKTLMQSIKCEPIAQGKKVCKSTVGQE